MPSTLCMQIAAVQSYQKSFVQPAVPLQLQLQVPAMHTAAFLLNDAVQL